MMWKQEKNANLPGSLSRYAQSLLPVSSIPPLSFLYSEPETIKTQLLRDN